ncbi:MAG: hypothetical protein JO250_10930 [Armatimonadetes bacterium]|nr:hypothetical protein [Armatimonadota bacterium]
MISELAEGPQQTFTGFVRHWLRLLSEDRLPEACGLLDEPNRYGIVWTPELIRRVVAETFDSQTLFYLAHPEGPRFTDPSALPEAGQQDETFDRFDDGNGYRLDYPVPLNGEGSDLTAQFEFRARPGGYAAILDDLHVL